MNENLKTKELLIKELQDLRNENYSLKAINNKNKAERNVLKDSLQETFSRLTLAMQAGNMAWWEMDVTTKEVTFDKLKVEMLGYSPENFKHYTDFTNLVHPDDYKRIMNAMKQHYQGATKSYEVEYRMLTQTGEYKWFYDYGSVVKRDATGKPLICTGFAYNINERKKAEEKLLFINKAVESTSDAIGISDARGHHIYQNKALSDLFEYNTAEELDSAGGDKVLFNDPETLKRVQDNILNGKFQSGEIEMITKTGRIFPAYGRTDSIKDTNGNLLGIIKIITDFTKRKLADEDLRNSEQMLHTVMDNFPGVVFWKDIHLNFIGCNKSFAVEAGLKNTADIVGKSDFDMPWGETDSDKYRKDDIEVIEKGLEKLHIIESHKQSDGSVIWFDTSKFALKDSQNKVVGVIGVSSDISKLKIAEQELIIINKSLAFQFEEKGKRTAELLIANKELIFQNEEKEKRKAELEIRVIERTGQLAETNRNLYKEIEERKRTEVQLLIQSSALNAVANAIMISDISGNVQWINKAFTKLTGYSSEEIIGGNSRILKSGKHDTAFYKELWETVLSGKVWHGELINKRKNNSEYYEEMTITPLIDESGAIARFIAVKNDITDRKSVEDEYKKAKNDAEDANKMKSKFLANMSHEIRTPLNSIVGFSNILKEKLTGQNINVEYLDNIMLSSNILLNLINDILDLSKVEAGKMVIVYHQVDLKNIINEIHTIFKMKASEKGISLNVTISEDIPANLITDERYLRQILFNLIGNALKFTHKGSVDVLVNRIKKNTDERTVDLKFSIKDTGIGVQENELTSIFEPFIQASKKDRNKYGGTGLGLSITKQLIELLGGEISVVSEIDKGSVFTFSLFNVERATSHSDEMNDTENKYPSEIKFNHPVLLLVEDILSNRQVVKGYLEKHNIIIVEAENGEECIKAIRIQKPDLILMDLQMPVMDGYTAIRIIKLDESFKNIPIIALSASGMKEQKDSIQIIADDFLLKPIYKNELIAKLMKYLPYDESTIKEEQQDVISNEHNPEKNSIKLLPVFKREMMDLFLPKILKQINTLNIDEIIDLVEKIEEYNKDRHIIEISDFCKHLSGYIQSFNIVKINTTLLHLSSIITK